MKKLTFCLFAALLMTGCYKLVYDRYDFTPRAATSPDHVRVYTQMNLPKARWNPVIGMICAPAFMGGRVPSVEEAAQKFKVKAASLGCDAVILMGADEKTDKVPSRLYWYGDKPYYTGSGEVSTGYWKAVGIVFE